MRMPMHLSLRAKGVLALAVLILYLALIGVFLNQQRQSLLVIVRQMETTQSYQAFLGPIVNSVAHSVVASQVVLNSGKALDQRWAEDFLVMHLKPIDAGLEQVRLLYPNLAPDVLAFKHAAAALRAVPSGEHLALMRDNAQQLTVKLQENLSGLRGRSMELGQQYQDRQQSISAFAIGANIVGAVASVAVIMSFFTALARDIKRLQHRAVAIVGGYAGPPLPNTRRDEVGSLIDAVNQMQVDLRRWEQQLEITRQQRFHQEKMAAVGSLAAAIAHEVSNPIAAISGVAQFIIDETRDDPKHCRTVAEFAGQILKQSERITHIMRQMSALTAHRSPEPELLDVNALVQSTSGFVRYDKRFAGIEFKEDLHPDVPAVTAVADHLTQVLMNLLINAADAMDHLTEPGRKQIRIATRALADEFHLAVTDRGRGMSADVLVKAFDESFTTKPVGKGRGIGLFVCKTLIEKAGGRITLESNPDEGTTANLYLPLRPTSAAPA
jgi:two-component system, NtrC family, sensor kinase